MARENMGTNIDPGFVARVAAGIRYVVTGVGPENFFGPQQPLAPQAQDKTEGRAFDYPVGYNLRIQPRAGEPISFGQLRALADAYDLLRLVIETRKDQLESFGWEIVPKNAEKSGDSLQGAIKAVSEFLERPNREHTWAQWLRMRVEDILVIDASAVYPRQTRGGDLYALELIDPGTLKRVLDDTGRTPMPPDPAYQQILKGIPAADYSSDQLIYSVRNPRTNRIYGYSPVEQVIMTVNIALRRQMSQLDFYTSGNVPEAIAQVPEGWTAKQTTDFQLWWDSMNEGNMAQRRKMRFIPTLKDIVFPKKETLKDEYDEWLARIICFAFSISPTALIKQVNRASSEQMADTAKEEGLYPLLKFFADDITYIINKYHPQGAELKFQFKVQNKVAPYEQAQTNALYIQNKVLTPDEVREDLGMDALTDEQRAKAFPAPVVPGFDEKDPESNGSGDKEQGKQVPNGDKPDAKESATEERAKAAEKLVAELVRMLDPERVAEAMAKVVASRKPDVVELRPEVNVEVGDTTVNIPK